MLIYMAENKTNGKKYIGLTTKTLEERKKTHERDSKNGKTYFNKAIKKYGVEGFDWIVLDNESKSLEELQEKEIFFIEKYNTFNNREVGYNSTSGGQYFRVTDEERKRRSERMKGDKNPMYGVPSPNTGKTFSEEHRKKMSESGKKVDRYWLEGDSNPSAVKVIDLTTMEIYGTKKEASERCGVSTTWLNVSINEGRYAKGHLFSLYEEGRTYKKVPKGKGNKNPVINLTNNKVYDSMSAAESDSGVSRTTIRKHCKLKSTDSKGNEWRFLE